MRTLFVLLTLSMTGCASSLNPLYETNADLLDPKDYLGVWTNGHFTVRTMPMPEKTEERLVYIEFLEDPRMGRIPFNMPTPPGNGAILLGGLVKLGDHVFLDLTYPPEMLNVFAPDLAPTSRMMLVQTHFFSKVKLKKDELVLQSLEIRKLVELLAKNPKLVAHKRIHQRGGTEPHMMAPSWKDGDARPLNEASMATGNPSLLFTAETADLRAFFAKHATADIWSKESTFARGNNADFEKHFAKLLDRLNDAKERRKKDEIPSKYKR